MKKYIHAQIYVHTCTCKTFKCTRCKVKIWGLWNRCTWSKIKLNFLFIFILEYLCFFLQLTFVSYVTEIRENLVIPTKFKAMQIRGVTYQNLFKTTFIYFYKALKCFIKYWVILWKCLLIFIKIIFFFLGWFFVM